MCSSFLFSPFFGSLIGIDVPSCSQKRAVIPLFLLSGSFWFPTLFPKRLEEFSPALLPLLLFCFYWWTFPPLPLPPPFFVAWWVSPLFVDFLDVMSLRPVFSNPLLGFSLRRPAASELFQDECGRPRSSFWPPPLLEDSFWLLRGYYLLPLSPSDQAF